VKYDSNNVGNVALIIIMLAFLSFLISEQPVAKARE